MGCAGLGLSTPALVQPPDRARRRGQRLPAGYGPRALPRLHVVGDGGEQPAQLDGGRQFASLIEDGADRRGLCLADHEHPGSMGARTAAGKQDRRMPAGGEPVAVLR
jgi:hypothetical protein